MTSNQEDYLKVLYEAGGLERHISNKEIADKLAVAPASVSEMLAKLNQNGLVEYEPYKGSRLTEAGLAACMDVVRSHRLWEVFLMRHLGYTWREAHEDAHLLEHVAPARMVERLDMFLNHPRMCPHGHEIPQRRELPHPVPLLRLSDLHVGERAVVSQIEEEGALLDYLERIGLHIRKPVEVVEIEEYEGGVTFVQEGRMIHVGQAAARRIFVEREEGSEQ
ncbi:MAG: metal-dependent transcriptional regulator [Sphaerochaetaceae bacterium]|jgi:DtxR family Mn-dependent transcriptional regulator